LLQGRNGRTSPSRRSARALGDAQPQLPPATLKTVCDSFELPHHTTNHHKEPDHMNDSVSLFLELWRQSVATLSSAQDRFRATTHVFVVTSLGLSAFILGKDVEFGSRKWVLAGAADVVLLALFFFLAYLSTTEVNMARVAVESKEAALQGAVKGSPPTELFPTLSPKAKMSLVNERRTALAVGALVTLKAAVLFGKGFGLL
jgi:hypothetical protein